MLRVTTLNRQTISPPASGGWVFGKSACFKPAATLRVLAGLYVPVFTTGRSEKAGQPIDRLPRSGAEGLLEFAGYWFSSLIVPLDGSNTSFFPAGATGMLFR